MIRLLALDIDGTLLDSHGQVPAANIDAVGQAAAAGVEVVLATGRRYDFARPVFDQFPGPLTLILSNGAIVKRRDGATLARHLLARDVARGVLERAPEHRGAAALLFDRARDGQIVYERIDWDHPRHRRFYELNREFISLVSPLESALTEDPLQVMFTGTCGDMRDLYERLAPGGDDDGYAVTLTEYQFRDFSLVDVIRAGCSKGSALRELAAARGVDPREVMAVGDNMNDLSMLEFAGCPVVMGNGVADLRGRGWPIAPTNDEAGVAAAIGTYILDPASIEG